MNRRNPGPGDPPRPFPSERQLVQTGPHSKELDCPGDKCMLGRDHDYKTTYKVLLTADSQSGAASFSFRTSICMSSEILRKSITLSMISPTTRGGPESI